MWLPRLHRRLRELKPAADPDTLIAPVADDAYAELPDWRAGGARRAAFDAGEEPLPACSSIPPRTTGWERDWQASGGGNGPQDGYA